MLPQTRGVHIRNGKIRTAARPSAPADQRRPRTVRPFGRGTVTGLVRRAVPPGAGGAEPEIKSPADTAGWHAGAVSDAEVLLIGGRAGAGKTTVAWEVSALLRAADVAHAVVEGDYMGQVHPAPDGDPHRSRIAERNLTAVWANFAGLGCRRLVYTNTLSVLPEQTGMFERAMGAGVRIVRVLLTAADATVRARLTRREPGSELEDSLASSHRRSRLLRERAPDGTVRVPTDGRPVTDIARDVLAATGWAGPVTSAGAADGAGE